MKNKGNDGTGNIPERDLWETSQELFDKLNEQYDFSFDCCANENNKKCDMFTDSLHLINQISVTNMCWMNPPFSNAMLMFNLFFELVSKGVAIYRCDNMETKVWQEVILKNASWIFIPKGRVSYKSFEVGDMRKGRGTRFPSALIGFNVEPIKDMEGITLFINKD